MKQVFAAGTSLEAHVISHLLEQAGIKTNITGDALAGARGELPAQDLATIWVMDDADYNQARELIKELQTNT